MATAAAADVTPLGAAESGDHDGDHYVDPAEGRGFFAGLPATLRDFYEALGVGDLLRGDLSDEPEPKPGPK